MRQFEFSRMWDGYESDKEAMRQRNFMARRLRKEGKRVECHTMKNQMRKCYRNGENSFVGCNVYVVTVYDQ